MRTFVFEEVTHASTSSEHELRDVLDDLRFVLWRKSREPFCQPLGNVQWTDRAEDDNSSERTTLPCRESRMRYLAEEVNNCTWSSLMHPFHPSEAYLIAIAIVIINRQL